jgi:superfamily II DNA or RNA helicase
VSGYGPGDQPILLGLAEAEQPSREAAQTLPAPYAALSRAARLVALVYGVAAPCALGVPRIQRSLSRAGLLLDGRRLDVATVRRCKEELIAAGFAERSFNAGVSAAPPWSFTLARIAHEKGCLTPLFREIRAQQRGFEPFADQMRLRCDVIRGGARRLLELEARVEARPQESAWEFLAAPLADDLLRKLPDGCRGEALTACLNHVIDTGAPPAPTVRLCRELSPAPGVHAADIAFIRVLQGRFDEALAGFDGLGLEDQPADSRERRTAASGLAATRALIALLHGDDEAAQRHIEESLARERAGSRKRLVFPHSKALAWSLLALVRLDTASANELFDRVLRGAELNPSRCCAGDLLWVRDARAVRTTGWRHGRRRSSGLDALAEGLWNCWRDERPGSRFDRRELEDYRRQAAANGYAWVVAECDEVLGRCRQAASRASRTAGDAGHGALGTRSLIDLVAPVPEWEQALKSVEEVARDLGRKAARRGKAPPSGRRRLAWEVSKQGDDDDWIELRVREQRQYRNGSWTKGRRIAPKRLVAEFHEKDFLLPQDSEAIKAVGAERTWGSRLHYEFGLASLFALAGHPHVYNDEGELVDVVRRPARLIIDEDAEGRAVVRMAPRDDGLEPGYAVRMETERRAAVTRFEAEHRSLLKAVPEAGLVLPASAKPRLMAAVSDLASTVRVQSDAVAGVAGAVSVEADPEPWVVLEPMGVGLTASLVVEPVPDSEIFFTPGVGGANVFAHRAGEPVQARRDLDAERFAVDRLIDRCSELASRPTEREPLAFPEPGHGLELLDRLSAVDARCKWPRGEPFRIVGRASAASLRLTLKSSSNWLEASGGLAVDQGRVVDLRRLFELLDERPASRFLELEKGEFLALTGALRRQLDDFAGLSAPAAKGASRLHRLAAPALDDLFDDAEVDADAGWRELRARRARAESFEPELPSTLRAELRPYQVDGYRWLARLAHWGAGACLADDMGLGKTVQTLAVLLHRAPGGPALVVAPTSVVANWVDEARRFAPTLNVRVYAGPASARSALLERTAPFDLVVTTYGLLQKDGERLAETSWHSVVLDEAQAIKNPVAKRTRAARRLPAEFRMVTTGTPIQNNLMDLHSLFGFVNPGLLGSLQAFRRRFGLAIERDGDVAARTRLRRLIAPFVLRRLKAEVLDDLPERTEITLRVSMSTAEAEIYEALRQRAVEELEAARGDEPELGEGARRVQVLAHLTRLRLACCDPRLVLAASEVPSSKLAAFHEILEELLANRHKVLVFSQFVKHLGLIEEHLKSAGVSYQYLDGSTPAKVRTGRIAAFQAGEGDVFLISLRAGGVGLNLTAADYVIHMDPWWNPAVEDQASDRAHRIGQTRPVTVYRLVMEGAIEERIVDLHRHKRELADQLLDGASAAGRLSAEELLDLIRKPAGNGDSPRG